MPKNILSICIVALVAMSQFANAQSVLFRKPDMKIITEKANKNFQKAIAAGQVQNTATATTLPSQQKNSLDYTQLPEEIRVPGQFEESQAIAMTWQYGVDSLFNITDIPSDDTDTLGIIACNLAAAIQKGAKVIIRIQAAADSTTIINIMSERGTPLTNYGFYVHPIDSFWDRDSGPISFYYGPQDSIGMIDLDYYTFAAIENAAGDLFTDFESINEGGRLNDDLIPGALGDMLGYPVYKTPLNDEGGNIISDGLGAFYGSNGTRISNTEPIDGEFFGAPGTYIYGNYPNLSDTQFDSLFLSSFGINTHVETEVFECDGGTGHIDIFGKLIDENHIALVDYSAAINHTDFDKWNNNLLQLQGTTDGNDKPLTIRYVPMPRIADGSIQTECEISPYGNSDQRTYLNGVFVNKYYIMPMQSDQSDPIPSDIEAIAAFNKAMPGYTILPIDASIMFGFGGALHCITMQIPAENPIFIRHKAITGLQPLSTNYAIDAFIKNKSGLASQLVYYRKSTNSDWIAAPLAASGADYYTSNIPSSGFVAGDTIQYFIEAESNNGKTISKPFVAREGGYYQFIIDGASSINGNINGENAISKIFPNPTSGSFTLSFIAKQSSKVHIEISDVLGRNIYSDSFTAAAGLNQKEIDLSTQTSGFYIVTTSMGGHVIKSHRLVKQ